MNIYRMAFGEARDLLLWLTDTGGLLDESQARLIDERTIELTQEAIDLLSGLEEDHDGIVSLEDKKLVMYVGGVSYPLTGVDD